VERLLVSQLGLGSGILITLLLAFVVAAVVVIILAALNALRSPDRASRTAYELAKDVLRERLQRGEIDARQYAELRQRLDQG